MAGALGGEGCVLRLNVRMDMPLLLLASLPLVCHLLQYLDRPGATQHRFSQIFLLFIKLGEHGVFPARPVLRFDDGVVLGRSCMRFQRGPQTGFTPSRNSGTSQHTSLSFAVRPLVLSQQSSPLATRPFVRRERSAEIEALSLGLARHELVPALSRRAARGENSPPAVPRNSSLGSGILRLELANSLAARISREGPPRLIEGKLMVGAVGEDLHEPSAEEVHSAAAAGVRTQVVGLPYLDRIQASFGHHSVGHVKAHVGAEAAQASRTMNARAFANGEHVVFGSTPDLRTAAHEAAHVVQQQAGVHLARGVGRAGDSYERHADAVADAVVAGRSAEGLLEPFAAWTRRAQTQQPPQQLGAQASQNAVQRKAIDLSGANIVKPASPPTAELGKWFYKIFRTKPKAQALEDKWNQAETDGGLPLPDYGVEEVAWQKALLPALNWTTGWAFRSKAAKGDFFQASKTIKPLEDWVTKQNDAEVLRNARRIFTYARDNIGDAQGFVVVEPGLKLKFIDINTNGTSPGLEDVLTAM
jgi:hypothetical protein